MAEEESGMSPKDRIVAFVMGCGITFLGVAMWIWRDSGISESDEPTRAKTRLIAQLIDWLWSRPVGVIAILIGLLFVIGAFMKASGGDTSAEGDTKAQ